MFRTYSGDNQAVVEKKVRDQTGKSGTHAWDTRVSQTPGDREGVQNADVASAFTEWQPHDGWILYAST